MANAIKTHHFIDARTAYSANSTKEKELQLKKSDFQKDYLHNRAEPDEKSTKKHHTSLYLSHVLQKVRNNSREQFEEFFKKNRDIENVIQKIPLDEELSTIPVAAQNIRKLRLYASWVEQKQNGNGSSYDLEKNYLAVQAVGKDEQIKALFERERNDYEHAQRIKEKFAFHYYSYFPYPTIYAL